MRKNNRSKNKTVLKMNILAIGTAAALMALSGCSVSKEAVSITKETAAQESTADALTGTEIQTESGSTTAAEPDTSSAAETESTAVPVTPAHIDAAVSVDEQAAEAQTDSSQDMSIEDMINSIYKYVDNEVVRAVMENATGVALGALKPEEYHAGGKTYYELGTINYDDFRKLNDSNTLFFKYSYVADPNTQTCKIFIGPIEDATDLTSDAAITERTAELKELYAFIQKAKTDTAGMSDRDKADYISEWMGRNFTYDVTYHQTHTWADQNVLKTFTEHKGVCSSLSGLYYVIGRNLGLNVREMQNDRAANKPNSPGHSWIQIIVDQGEFYIDPAGLAGTTTEAQIKIISWQPLSALKKVVADPAESYEGYDRLQ